MSFHSLFPVSVSDQSRHRRCQTEERNPIHPRTSALQEYNEKVFKDKLRNRIFKTSYSLQNPQSNRLSNTSTERDLGVGINLIYILYYL